MDEVLDTPDVSVVYKFPREWLEIVWRGGNTMLVRPYGQELGYIGQIACGMFPPTQAEAFNIALEYVRNRSYHA